MKWLNHFTIRGSMTILALAGILGFLSYFIYGTSVAILAVNKINSVNNQYFPTLILIDAIFVPLHKSREILAEAINEEDPDLASDAEIHIDKILANIEKIKQLSPSYISDCITLSRLLNNYFNSAQTIANALITGQKISLLKDDLDRMTDQFNKFDTLLSNLKLSQQETLHDKLSEATSITNGFRIRGLYIGLGVLITMIFLVISISRRINNEFKYAMEAANHIAEQNYDVDIEHNNKNEIGRLLSSIERMKNNLKDNKRWDQANSSFAISLADIDITTALNSACDLIFQELDLLGLTLYVKNQTGKVELYYFSGHKNAIDSDEIDNNNSLAEKIITSKQSQIINGPFNNDTYSINVAIGTIKPCQILGWPVFNSSDCVGALIVYSSHDLSANEQKYINKNMSRFGIRIMSFMQEQKSIELIENLQSKSRDLEIANKLAQQANNAKSEFLATMSHEIRTPINGVIGTAGLLLKTTLNQKQREYAEATMKSANYLLSIINDILDFSKIEAGKLELESVPFDLQALSFDVAELMAIKCREKKIVMLLRYKPETPRFFHGDPGRIRQILLNLLSNAIKFTENGHILLGIEAEFEADNTVTLKSYITDTGIGVSTDKISRIFNQFDQGDNSTTRNFGGTGLGLAITKQLCQMMGGDINVVSTPGEGATFHFTVKLSKDLDTESNIEALETFQHLNGRIALIIDAMDDSRKIIEELLTTAGISVSFAYSAKEALLKLGTPDNQHDHFDIIISDTQMPDMSTEQYTVQLCQLNAINNGTLIFVTPNAQRVDSSHLQELGADGYITNPIHPDDFLTIISKAWQARQKLKSTTIKTPVITRYSIQDTPIDPLKHTFFHDTQIMVVEDNQVNVMVATEMIKAFNCSVTPAGNGIEALSIMDNRTFDLVFMDCQMPEMDGYQATRKIRFLEKTTDTTKVPIIALTANAMKGDKEKCMESGMDDYLSKPLSDDALEAMLLKWLPHKLDNNTESSTDITQPAVNVAITSQKSTVYQLDIDTDQLLDLIPFNKLKMLFGDKFNELILQNRASFKKNFNNANTAIIKSDFETLERAGHSLKSSSRQFGALQLGNLAEKIEFFAKDKKLVDAKLALEKLAEIQKQTSTLIDEQLGIISVIDNS